VQHAPWLWADPRDVARLDSRGNRWTNCRRAGDANRLLLLALRIAPRTLVVRAGGWSRACAAAGVARSDGAHVDTTRD
jgi:hypothetical protein